MLWWKHSTIRIRLSYHQWLTPAQYGSRFGASRQDLARITGWLNEHGFMVNEIAVNHRQITFSGNAGQVEDTFHTQIHRLLVDGENHIANTQDPQIPSAMAGVVRGILSLHNFRHGLRYPVTSQFRGPSAVHEREHALSVSGGLGHSLRP